MLLNACLEQLRYQDMMMGFYSCRRYVKSVGVNPSVSTPTVSYQFQMPFEEDISDYYTFFICFHSIGKDRKIKKSLNDSSFRVTLPTRRAHPAICFVAQTSWQLKRTNALLILFISPLLPMK